MHLHFDIGHSGKNYDENEMTLSKFPSEMYVSYSEQKQQKCLEKANVHPGNLT